MAYFAVNLVLEMNTRQSGQSFYNDLRIDFQSRSVREASFVDKPAGKPLGNAPLDAAQAHVPFMDFDSTRENIPDLVAWIHSNGTEISYPVVHGEDNDYYLSHLPDKSKNKIGSIFLDSRNLSGFSDKNILIYGHNMSSGDMFGSLKNYSNQRYFDEHQSMYLFTPAADYELILYAGYVLDSAKEVPPTSFVDSSDFEWYISDISRRSLFKSDAEVSFGEQLVFLCTCTPGGSKDERLVIVCKLAGLEM